jgi:hypothetical protein
MRTRKIQSGFTLFELLIGSSMAAVVMVALLSSFLFIGRNLARLANYQSLQTQARTALAYLRRDFAVAESVKSGTTPTASSVTIVLPAGEVTYTYDNASRNLRRQANFGANRDFSLLRNSHCECTSFAFRYFTTTDGQPTDQASGTASVPYSIKRIEIGFVLESPSTTAVETRTRYEAASSRFLIRNRRAPDGT